MLPDSLSKWFWNNYDIWGFEFILGDYTDPMYIHFNSRNCKVWTLALNTSQFEAGIGVHLCEWTLKLKPSRAQRFSSVWNEYLPARMVYWTSTAIWFLLLITSRRTATAEDTTQLLVASGLTLFTAYWAARLAASHFMTLQWAPRLAASHIMAFQWAARLATSHFMALYRASTSASNHFADSEGAPTAPSLYGSFIPVSLYYSVHIFTRSYIISSPPFISHSFSPPIISFSFPLSVSISVPVAHDAFNYSLSGSPVSGSSVSLCGLYPCPEAAADDAWEAPVGQVSGGMSRGPHGRSLISVPSPH